MNWKSIIKTTHVWIGLIFGAFLCLTCLSGSIAVFRPQLQAAFGPKLAIPQPGTPRVGIDDAVAQVLAQNAGARVTRLLLPAPDRNTFVLTLESGQKTSRRVVIDAATGAIAGDLNVAWLDWIIDLHHNLLFGKAGRLVVGVVGIILLVMSASGLVLSLFRGLSWKSFTSVTVSGPRRRLYFELHRATGLWAFALLMLLSFTGIELAYPDAFRLVLGQRTGNAKTKPSGHQAFKPLKEYLEAGRAALPSDAQLTELRLPKSAKDAISVRFRMPGDLGDAGRNELSLAANGSVLGVRKGAEDPLGVRIQSSFTPIHYGEVGGLAVRTLWCLAGLTPLVLYASGLLFWFRKKPRRAAVRLETSDEFLVTQRSL